MNPRPLPDFAWWVLRAQWVAGLFPLFFLDPFPRSAVAAAAAAFLAGTALDRSQAPRAGWSRWAAPLLAAAFLGSILDALAGSRDPLRSLSFLILVLQAVRFLLPKGTREGWQLCTLSYLEFLMAANGTSDVRFAALLFLYLGLSAGAMTVLTAGGAARAREGRVEPARAALSLLVLAAGGFVLTAVLFAVTPRIGFTRFVRPGTPPERISGFSRTISLRDVTAIKVDRTVVARIEFPVLPGGVYPEILHLKGTTYSRFDGSEWSREAEAPIRVFRSGFVYAVAPPPGPGLLTADIALEPMDNPALFVYGSPVTIEGNLGELLTDGRDGFVLAQPAHAAIRYRLQASLEPPRSGRPLPPPGPEYLRIPDGWDDLRRLAAEIAAGAKTDRERAERLKRHFRTGYRYTLTDPAPTVRHFLFGSRAGFCEHYATALALLLRASGIPARVAAGYRGGEWNDLGQYLIVRQSDAHAWTEGWIGGQWMTLDATPAAGSMSLFAARTGPVGMYLDWLKQRWNKYVVNFSVNLQAEGLSEGWTALRRLPDRVARALRGDEGLAGAALIAAPAALLLLLGLRRRRSRRRADAAWASAAPAPGAAGPPRSYARLARRLAARGHRPSPGTPLSAMVLSLVAAKPELAPDAGRFLDLYHRDRFGTRPLSAAESREAAALAARLRRAVAPRRAA